MIVKIAACLYILQAALGLLSMSLSPLGFRASMANLLVLAGSVLFAAMGVGLLKKAPWARWMALGNSWLGWAVGTLMFLALVALYFLVSKLIDGILGGFGPIFSFLVGLLALIFIASIVISFKLYFYLRSEEGAAEFGVELEPVGSVVMSVAAWLVIACVQGLFASSDISSFIPSGSAKPDREEQTQNFEIERSRELVRQQRILEAQQAQLQRERAAMDEQQARLLASPPESTVVAAAEEPAVRYEPTVSTSSPSTTETPSRNQILKCRDASGAMQYTQGYCPPGTQRVEMPTSE